MGEKVRKPKIFSLGLQHVLAMYAGAILVPLIVRWGIRIHASATRFPNRH